MEIISRQDFGFDDGIEGFIAKKENIPILQLHLYNDYNTLFWLGGVDFGLLDSSLIRTIEEIGQKMKVPFNNLNRGLAQYADDNDLMSYDFEVVQTKGHSESVSVYLKKDGRSIPITEARAGKVLFARYDVHGLEGVPIILWADLAESEDSEVGFSTNIEFPNEILYLFRETCRIEVDLFDLDQLRKELESVQ